MSQDLPSVDDLLVTVREFIDEVTPQLEGRDRYHALCAAYLLEIVRRELGQAPAADSEERAMLARYLGPGHAGPAGLAALGHAIRSGALDARWDELLADVAAQVTRQVRVTRPDVLHPMHR